MSSHDKPVTGKDEDAGNPAAVIKSGSQEIVIKDAGDDELQYDREPNWFDRNFFDWRTPINPPTTTTVTETKRAKVT